MHHDWVMVNPTTKGLWNTTSIAGYGSPFDVMNHMTHSHAWESTMVHQENLQSFVVNRRLMKFVVQTADG